MDVDIRAPGPAFEGSVHDGGGGAAWAVGLCPSNGWAETRVNNPCHSIVC